QEKGKLFLEKDIWFICSFLFLLFSLWFIMDIIGRFVNIQNQKKIRSLVKQEKNDRLRALGALASGFSHEFASPLNAVKLTIERLKQSIASGNYYEDLLMASKAIDSCEFVLKQMNASQMDPQSSLFKKVDMKMFLNDVCDSWLEVHPGCFFEKSIEHQYCEIPIVHFAQTVINLLDNAYESNPNGKIALNFMKKEEYFHLIVIDDGPGFPKEILSKIGEPFLTSKINGTGLGIYVSELLAQSLSGELCIKNKKTEDGALVNLLWPCSNGNG
ncbi:MAG: HAMP domain-containing histidine kinase, partial [Bdellovibrionaceae bacterium]|nr:HAMP domain-containing histidine kinase [Pseudobdellovibrionaceae bacterium]